MLDEKPREAQIRFDNAEQHIKIFNAFLSDPDMADEKEMHKSMSGWRAEEQATSESLKKKGLRAVSISRKFARAGMASEYATAYGLTCTFSHSNLNTLLARHVREGKLTFEEPMRPETLKMVVGMALANYSRAIETLPAYTEIGDAVKKVMEEVNAKWQKAQ